jgi:hypothetical protein
MGRRGVKRWGWAVAACSIAFVAHADELFERKTREADSMVSIIDQLTRAVEAERNAAAERGQSLRMSCLETQVRAAHDNQKVAHKIRESWDVAADSIEYRERSMERLVRLQVYALVFQDQARACASAESVAHALAAEAPPPPAPAGSSDGLAPDQPRLERPPLASPF